MKPLNENPFQVKNIVMENAMNEIKAFMEYDCKFAELDKDETVSITTNIERYRKACRKLRYHNDMYIRTSKGKIIAIKE